MNNRFKKGDLVKHSCAGKSDHMNAIFMSYIKYISPRKVIVKYTEGDRKGVKGEWSEEYVKLRGVTSEKSEDSVHAKVMDGKDLTPAEERVYKAYSEYMRGKHDDKAIMASHKHKGKENIMKAIIIETYTDGVLTETLINDRNVEDLGSGELLGYATSAQQAIEKLAKHDGSKCKFLAKEHKRLQNFIDSVYILVDQKNGLPPA